MSHRSRRHRFTLPLLCAALTLMAGVACSDLPPARSNLPPVQRAVVAEVEHALKTADSARMQAAPSTPLTRRDLLSRQQVPTARECLAAGIGPCYAPAQIQRVYGVDRLLAQGIDGTGVTIAIVVSFGSPTLADDVKAFSRVMGLPDADLTEIYPLGTDFKEISHDDTAGWGGETTLDAEWAHAMAPGARIVVLASPVSETEGVDGLPEFLALEQYAIDNYGSSGSLVISQSWGTSENLLEDDAGAAMRAQFDAFYQTATAAGVTVLTASGDHGALGDNLDETPASVRAADWPSSVPWVTTVGGTALTLNDDGSYGSERVMQCGAASGSGISRFYAAPAEESLITPALRDLASDMRAEADVSALGCGLITYTATGGRDGGPHPGIVGGTSASTPVWAGIVALADQAAGHGLGNINPTLYTLGAAGRCFHDVVQGTNAFHGDPGDVAGQGYDLPTGWGTPDAACLVPALAGGGVQS